MAVHTIHTPENTTKQYTYFKKHGSINLKYNLYYLKHDVCIISKFSDFVTIYCS